MKNTVNLENLKKLFCNKKMIFSILMVLCTVAPIFAANQTAQNYDFGMNNVMKIVIGFLTSRWIIGVVIALLAFEIILFITAGRADNQAWKKFVPIILGTGLFLAAPRITNYFINAGTLGTTQDTALKVLDGTYTESTN